VEFRQGQAPEYILQSYPSIGSLANVYAAIAFILEHPQEIEAYCCDLDAAWEKFKTEHPMPERVLQQLRGVEEELTRRSA
jgi:hypothetical protein